MRPRIEITPTVVATVVSTTPEVTQHRAFPLLFFLFFPPLFLFPYFPRLSSLPFLIFFLPCLFFPTRLLLIYFPRLYSFILSFLPSFPPSRPLLLYFPRHSSLLFLLLFFPCYFLLFPSSSASAPTFSAEVRSPHAQPARKALTQPLFHRLLPARLRQRLDPPCPRVYTPPGSGKVGSGGGRRGEAGGAG